MSPLAGLCWKHGFDAPLPVDVSACFNQVELPSACDDEAGFYSILADPSNLPTASVPYTYLVPVQVKGSKHLYDLMVACYTGPDKPLITLVIEIKSAAGMVLSTDKPAEIPREDLRCMPDGGSQYTRTKCQLERSALSDGVPNTGLLKHIRDGHWVYVYMSTHAKHESAFGGLGISAY